MKIVSAAGAASGMCSGPWRLSTTTPTVVPASSNANDMMSRPLARSICGVPSGFSRPLSRWIRAGAVRNDSSSSLQMAMTGVRMPDSSAPDIRSAQTMPAIDAAMGSKTDCPEIRGTFSNTATAGIASLSVQAKGSRQDRSAGNQESLSRMDRPRPNTGSRMRAPSTVPRRWAIRACR